MLLSVKQNDQLVNELQFTKGPIYIGRQMGSQVFLPEVSVSRQHAVIYSVGIEKWVIEDLGSANKTFLNGRAIHKYELQNNDVIQIAGFTINVQFEKTAKVEEPALMEDTIVGSGPDVDMITRQLHGKDTQGVTISAKRVRDLSTIMQAICKATSIKELHRVLLSMMLKQFAAENVWVSLRTEGSGPMAAQGGRKINSEVVRRSELVMPHMITDAMEKRKYMLVPRIPAQVSSGSIRSIIIAPILKDSESYGIIYAENSPKHESYSIQDLDYLILVSIHTGAILERL